VPLSCRSLAPRKLLPLLLLAMLGLGSLAPAPGWARVKHRFANAIWGPIKLAPGQGGCGGPARCSAFPYYRELGVDVFQFQIKWNEVAPTRPADPRNPDDPAYRWSSDFQLAVDQAAASGIRLAAMIKGSPPWANGGLGSNWAPRARDFADFAWAAAQKFPSIDLWMIWGEPTRPPNFMPQGRAGARRYARILDHAYGALKRAGRDNVVIGGMTLSDGYTEAPAWIKNMRLGGGRRPRMDWYGHNPFQRRAPRLRDDPVRADGGRRRGLNDLDTLWKELNRAYRGRTAGGRRPRKLWLSEYTVQSDGPSWAFQFFVSRQAQAARLRKSFALARRLPYVAGMGWFSLSDYPPAPNNPTWGLISYDGEKKPAYEAYEALP
jgi:hypothetical protein